VCLSSFIIPFLIPKFLKKRRAIGRPPRRTRLSLTHPLPRLPPRILPPSGNRSCIHSFFGAPSTGSLETPNEGSPFDRPRSPSSRAIEYSLALPRASLFPDGPYPIPPPPPSAPSASPPPATHVGQFLPRCCVFSPWLPGNPRPGEISFRGINGPGRLLARVRAPLPSSFNLFLKNHRFGRELFFPF